jgi:GDP-D-mannose 3', 5'-epimerase
MKTALVLGSSGLIGSHMVRYLKAKDYRVVGVGRTCPHPETMRDIEFITIDLRFVKPNDWIFDGVQEVYQFASEVGGLGFIANKANNAEILRNSTQIDLAVLEACRHWSIPKVFFASSACVYNFGQRFYKEADAYPANCSNEFAWQKLFAERLYQSYADNYGLQVRIGRLFNCYGTGITWKGERAKVVASICRKIAQAKDGDAISVWGNGEQTRSFTYVDDAVEGIYRLMQSDVKEPVNIGPAHEVTIRDLIEAIKRVSGNIVFCQFDKDKPSGVSRICSDNTLIRARLGWEPKTTIEEGLKTFYPWLVEQLDRERNLT